MFHVFLGQIYIILEIWQQIRDKVKSTLKMTQNLSFHKYHIEADDVDKMISITKGKIFNLRISIL